MIRRTVRLLVLALIAVLPTRAQGLFEDRFFDSHGVRIRYVEAGRGDPVVLIHGGVGNLDMMWRDSGVMDALARDFHVIAFDVRGHGKSDKPHGVSRYRGEMVEDVARLLDHLRIRQAHIVGYSMGGYLTAKFSALHPDRVLTATFGGAGVWTPEFERVLMETAESLEQGKGLRPLLATTMVSPNGGRLPNEEIDAQSRRALASNDPLALAGAIRGVMETHASPGELQALSMPLLAVVGSADPRVANVDALKHLRPEVKVVTIDGATHLGPTGAQARPEFVAAVREFLIAHPASSRSPGR
jgi:pimeloyl-ACP methyl ester carboxylesterase